MPEMADEDGAPMAFGGVGGVGDGHSCDTDCLNGDLVAKEQGRRQDSISEASGGVDAHLPSPSPSPIVIASRRESERPLTGRNVSPSTINSRLTTQVWKAYGDAEARRTPSRPPSGFELCDLGDGTGIKTRGRPDPKMGQSKGVRRLSASKMQELTAARESLPVAAIPARRSPLSASIAETSNRPSLEEQLSGAYTNLAQQADREKSRIRCIELPEYGPRRPTVTARTVSTPPTTRFRYRSSTIQPSVQPSPTRYDSSQPFPDSTDKTSHASSKTSVPPAIAAPIGDATKPCTPSVPLPPMSIPTLLQLELAGQRPSPLYIHHSQTGDLPYESNAVKLERLKNFLLLPLLLERTMTFGALACLDAWLWTFTILPLRFCISFGVLLRWWAYIVGKELGWLLAYVWHGLGRMWQRASLGRPTPASASCEIKVEAEQQPNRWSRACGLRISGTDGSDGSDGSDTQPRRPDPRRPGRANRPQQAPNGCNSSPDGPPSLGTSLRYRRSQSMPSHLTTVHKADLLQGAIILFSSVALMNLDASRMYHSIRAQSAIKLYTIYNLLEVGDRLLAALGQDVFECLFSSETLSRNSSGRSKIMMPFGMFILALTYNLVHSITLFYQVIALNVAVNSYSNTLLTLLMSNQFVEIKASVFKRIEKENAFQLTCADVVERFQLWVILIIIGMRNIVEVGGLSVPGASNESPTMVPLRTTSILPASFTILPSWLWSGEVLSPFFLVLGSEMVVDWVKHAFVNKFNNIKPNFYSRILDILCKDYYTNVRTPPTLIHVRPLVLSWCLRRQAFVTPSLTRRLGLPLLPLSCLFIRASVQTYNMLLATHLPTPLPRSLHTSLSVESAAPSPAMAAALGRLDSVIRNALGRAVYGYPHVPNTRPGGGHANGTASGPATHLWVRWTRDEAIAALTMVVVFLFVFLVLLVIKLLLGMVLLRYARERYAHLQAHEFAVQTGKAERQVFDARGKRIGSYGQVEVGDERRRWVYADDPEGLAKIRERERKTEKGGEKERDLATISRYDMVAKRIW